MRRKPGFGFASILTFTLWMAMVGYAPPCVAQVPDPIPPQDDAAGVFSALGIIGGIVFFSADVVYATEGSWLPPAWAWSQLGMAAFNLGGSVWQLSAEHGSTGLGITNLAFAGVFMIHGVLSLIYYTPPAVEVKSPSGQVALTYWPSISSTRGGGLAQVVGTF